MSDYKKFGIDVSHWQGDFDFEAAVKSDNVEFVIIKAGGTTDGEQYTDSKFETYYKDAKAAGLHVGAYFYGGATTTTEAETEAEYFASLLSGKQFDVPVYYDVEAANMFKLTKAKLTNVVKAFCDKMEDLGFFVGIYMSRSYYSSEVNDSKLTAYVHWVAEWKEECAYTGDYGMWQFGGETNLIRENTINGTVVDMDYMLVDYPTKIKNAHLNGYTEDDEESTAETSTEEVAETEETEEDEEVVLTAGMKLTLKNVSLYSTSTTAKVANTITGTYYLWSTDVCGKNRVRITNQKDRVGIKGQVTGWVNLKDII